MTPIGTFQGLPSQLLQVILGTSADSVLTGLSDSLLKLFAVKQWTVFFFYNFWVLTYLSFWNSF
jgi:hypothetical protein